MLDPELQIMVHEKKMDEITNLQEWMTQITEIDNKWQKEMKWINLLTNTRVDAAMTCAAKCQNTGQSTAPCTSTQYMNAWTPYNHSMNTTATSSSTYLPQLTDDEQCLLHEHEGCLKCWKFYIGYHTNTCTEMLMGKDYQVCTLQDALHVKALRGDGSQPAPVAAITKPNEQTTTPAPELVATIFLQAANILADTSTSESLDTSVASVSPVPPLKGKHLIWTCQVNNPTDHISVKTLALIDSGTHMVLICPDLVKHLNLVSQPLEQPERINIALSSTDQIDELTHYTIIDPASLDNQFCSLTLHAVIAPGLCMPIILGLPFLYMNKVVCDYASQSCLVTTTSPPYDLMAKQTKPAVPTLETSLPDVLAALKDHIMSLSFEEELEAHELKLWNQFSQIFEPPSHVQELPKEPVARIQLKDPNHCIKSWNYPSPQKWKDAWHTLLQQHLDAGRNWPSSTLTGCSAFIIPKANPNVLLWWVNDYQQLNSNTVTDSFPIPLVNEILANLGQGKVFTMLDMTNSFFQTRMHLDDVELTAVNTPWGLYEWVVMPMGIKNAPAIHQWRVTSALCPWIGWICHVYMDDIAIWSCTMEEHTKNVTTMPF